MTATPDLNDPCHPRFRKMAMTLETTLYYFRRPPHALVHPLLNALERAHLAACELDGFDALVDADLHTFATLLGEDRLDVAQQHFRRIRPSLDALDGAASFLAVDLDEIESGLAREMRAWKERRAEIEEPVATEDHLQPGLFA